MDFGCVIVCVENLKWTESRENPSIYKTKVEGSVAMFEISKEIS